MWNCSDCVLNKIRLLTLYSLMYLEYMIKTLQIKSYFYVISVRIQSSKK